MLEAALSGEPDRLAGLRDDLKSAYEWERLGDQLEDCSTAARTADGAARVSSHWTRLDQLGQSEFVLVRECSQRARELIRPKFEQEEAERREQERQKAAREATLDAFYRDEGLSVNFVTHGSARVSDLLETYAGCDATRVLGIPNDCGQNNSRVIGQFRGSWCPRNWREAVSVGGREVAEEVRRDFCANRFGANPHIGTDGCIKVLTEWCP